VGGHVSGAMAGIGGVQDGVGWVPGYVSDVPGRLDGVSDGICTAAGGVSRSDVHVLILVVADDWMAARLCHVVCTPDFTFCLLVW